MFENLTVNFNALCDSCANIASFSSVLILTSLGAGSSTQSASEQFVLYIFLSFFCKLRAASNSNNKNKTDLGLEVERALSR